MGCYTFLTEEEKERWSKVSCNVLNEIFQKAREFDKSLLISERTEVSKRFLKKTKTNTFYTVYHESPAADGSTYQARLETCVPSDKTSVGIYLYGIINGALAQLKTFPVYRSTE